MATAVLCCALPNVMTATWSDSKNRAHAPMIPSKKVSRRNTSATLFTVWVSPRALASAICRTPLRVTPASATARLRSSNNVSVPIKPTPAGPRSRARTFVLTMPIATLTSVAPPMTADDLRICR